ncbi:hypothetical protein BDM02DRAFT_3184486 [Thelephora ganbajun]|uniref:Uncharacterized protein n=1 Tax=Thelephora ganbajun TaxID=370292 RepID=A0ACB6ZPC0_THEGA|nr:hypothetical protein BDM02DRAFT_3184486 [Thelephora ganbajun]
MTRSARKATTEKRTKKDTEPKSKKVPSPYNLFVKAQLPIWREANPGKSAKDAMSAVSVMWKDSPENPKNAPGGEKKEPKAKKSASKTASKSSSKKADKESLSSDTD